MRAKPYDFQLVTPGIRMGYRRNKGTGVWVVKGTDGHRGEWTKTIGYADDFDTADGERIFDFLAAQDKARKIAGGNGGNAPATVDQALTDYATDLRARDGHPQTATHLQSRLPANILSKPVALLTANELQRWRNQYLATGLKPSSVLRVCKTFSAALNRAANHDPRIINRDAWRVGLGGLSDTFTARNVILTDVQVRAAVGAAYELDKSFGLYVEVHAMTGARSSQIAALTVSDLQNSAAPRLMMPCSRKGRGRKAGERKPVPISVILAAKLKTMTAGRPLAAPLLLRRDGSPWKPKNADHSRLFEQTAERAGLLGHTIYSLRHSSIVRSLLSGVPVRIVAVVHDTSVAMIERTYSHYIADHADEIARRGLLELSA